MKRNSNEKKTKVLSILIALMLVVTIFATGCSGNKGTDEGTTSEAPELKGLAFQSQLELKRAKGFSVYHYDKGYDLLDIHDSQRFLLVPEDGEIPEDLDDDIIILQKPIDRVYLAATAAMAMFVSMDALDRVRMSSVKPDSWTFDEPKEAMKKGDILYAGKYSEPDYETMLDQECDLALESTMIDHTPEVKEMIEEIGIPVMVDRASYETDPMGRAEWIKLYGVLTDHEKEAEAFYNEQLDSIKELDDFKNTEKTVALFYISSDNKAVVRRSTDYIPKMIEIAGARYVFKDLDDEAGRVSIDMSMEQFYETAKDADYIIYNGSIDGSVKDMKSLVEKDPIMGQLKAVKDNNCWATKSAMYQRTDLVADMILDFNRLFTTGDEKELKYIYRLE